MAKSALIAIGGNSLIRAGEKGTIAEQLANTRRTAQAIVKLMDDGFNVVVTHGNGPQVGAALIRSERASDQVYGHPLDVCDATTQGEIGYLMQQSLCNELAAQGKVHPVATVVTQVVVSAADPAMQKPTKPVGPFYSKEAAEEKKRTLGWQIVEDAARGWRRVVPSPEPLEIVEEGIIKTLLAQGVLVIAVGGGGIPVVREGKSLKGIEAVIDKDRASALLAARLGVDMFIISTDAQYVCLDYKKPTQRNLSRVPVAEMEGYFKAGHFPPGNMGPKVESALRFLKNGGHECIITSYEYLVDAVLGSAGTRIVQ
ncbi:MAG: carbamate kinase [Myxococcaceae bacterium]